MKFTPIFKDKIWGGQKVKQYFNMDFSPLSNCGEAWILSGVESENSVIFNGFLAGNELNELVEVYMGELVGESAYEKFGNQFPILIKLIDANDYLSIQVHPDDILAQKRHKAQSGKSEMWYIIDAEKDAELITGFNRQVDKETYLKHLENKALPEILNREKVKAGDVFFMPAGRIHALGPGILLAEIQQTSDLTYRIYDWDRLGADGKPREMHTNLALDAINFKYHKKYRTTYRSELNQTGNLVNCPHFTTNILEFDEPILKDYSALDSFVIYLCLEGDVHIKSLSQEVSAKPGEVVLLPAIAESSLLQPHGRSKVLEVYISSEKKEVSFFGMS